jgi:ferritin
MNVLIQFKITDEEFGKLCEQEKSVEDVVEDVTNLALSEGDQLGVWFVNDKKTYDMIKVLNGLFEL